MARGTASPGDDSSSSGFSSDEDMADVSNLPPAASLTPSVHVEVLDEDEETPPISSSTVSQTTPEGPAAFSNVLQCCQDITNPILRTLQPLDVQYEQFTAAIGHVTWHWPSSETRTNAVELQNALQSYHSLRADLYKVFQRAFPLIEDMYMQWISDVKARGDAGIKLQMLFELSHEDYWSVPLMLQYLRFLKESGDEVELERIMNKAQTTLGAHFARGHEIWALCRELTTEKFDEMDDAELQKERAIRELYCKQMQLPLDQNDLVMSEFRAWDSYNTRDTEASGEFEKASKRQSKLFAPLMKKLREFEARINAAPGTEDAVALEQAWVQYLNFVKHRVAPLMSSDKDSTPEKGKCVVVCLYERAMSAMCLSPTLWANYLEYLEPEQDNAITLTGRDSEKLAVARRAVRNVPFDSSAWTEILIELELAHKYTQGVAEFMQTSFLTRSNPPMDQFHLLNVLLAWCDSARRYASITIDGDHLEDSVRQVELLLGDVFSECEQFMSKAFPDFLEGKMRLAEYQAKCYWALMPPTESPRSTPAIAMKVSKVSNIWKNTLSTPLGDQAATWIAYLEALRRMNAYSVPRIREMVFDEAVKRVKDAPMVLAELWLIFERENGDLKNYLRARRYHAKHRTTAPVQAYAPATTSTHTEGETNVRNAKKRKSNVTTEGKKQVKGSQKQPAVKRVKLATNKKEGDATAIEVDEAKTLHSAEKKKVHESLTNEHTLFLCNVSKDASKEDIETLFSGIPTLKDVRLVVKTRGHRVKSRGMAYVQFTDEVGVEAGLKMDGSLLHGHPLRVERSKPPPTSASTTAGKSSGGEGFWKTDPLTLYIGDLNREGSKEQVTEEQLQTALQQTMQSEGGLVVVTRVSILKDRHGKLKNYGLVETAEPSQVSFCLDHVSALQKQLGEHVTMKPSRFSIAHILQQQEKQQQEKQQHEKQKRKASAVASGSRSGSASKGVHAPHARPSTRLALPTSGSATSLMPRALRRKLAAQNNAPKSESSETATASTVTPKSNEDFRKMLFNK